MSLTRWRNLDTSDSVIYVDSFITPLNRPGTGIVDLAVNERRYELQKLSPAGLSIHDTFNTLSYSADIIIPEGVSSLGANLQVQMAHLSCINTPKNISTESLGNTKFYIIRVNHLPTAAGHMQMSACEAVTILPGFYTAQGLHTAIHMRSLTSELLQRQGTHTDGVNVFLDSRGHCKLGHNGEAVLSTEIPPIPDTHHHDAWAEKYSLRFVFPLGREQDTFSRYVDMNLNKDKTVTLGPLNYTILETVEEPHSWAMECLEVTAHSQTLKHQPLLYHQYGKRVPSAVTLSPYTDTVAAKLGFVRLQNDDFIFVDDRGNPYMVTSGKEYAVVPGNILGSLAHLNVVVDDVMSLNGMNQSIAKIPMAVASPRSRVSSESRHWFNLSSSHTQLNKLSVKLLNDNNMPYEFSS